MTNIVQSAMFVASKVLLQDELVTVAGTFIAAVGAGEDGQSAPVDASAGGVDAEVNQ